MSEQTEEPEDLGVKIGSKRHAFLDKVRKAMEDEIQQSERTIFLNNLFLEVVENEIEKEKENFK